MWGIGCYRAEMPTPEVSAVKWKVAELLEDYGKTPYALAKASGLSMPTVYAIVNGEKKGVQFTALAAILRGLEELTGEPVELSDVLEVVR